MTPGMKLVTEADLNLALGEVLETHLLQLVKSRHDGHCMRVSDLDTPLMEEIGHKLAKSLAGW